MTSSANPSIVGAGGNINPVGGHTRGQGGGGESPPPPPPPPPPAPVLSAPSTDNITPTTALTHVTTTESGGSLYVVATTVNSQPSNAQIIAGQDASSAPAPHQSVAPSVGANGLALSGLSSNTPYYDWFLQVNSNGSSNVATNTFTTTNPPPPPPVLSSPGTTLITSTTARDTVTTDTAGGTLYVVATTTNSQPSNVQIAAGQNAAGSPTPNTSLIPVIGANNLDLTGLSPNTPYYNWYLQNAASGSSNVPANSFTTSPAPAPVLSAPNTISIGATGATDQVTTDTSGGTLYVVATTTNSQPSNANIIAGKDAAGSPAPNDAVTPAMGVNSLPVSGLTALTQYYNWYLQVVGALNSNVATNNFTTTAAPPPGVSNIDSKDWSIVQSYDLGYWSNWPAGDKPSAYQTSPMLLDTDIITGSMTGGENNKGAYLRLFVYSPGRGDKLGTAAGCRVFFRDPGGDNAWHEVDNYRYLKPSPSFTRSQVMEVAVQIGNFGGNIPNTRGGNPVPCDIKVTVNGVDSNILPGWFTPNPGNFYFVDNVLGNDSTGVVNDISHPYRYWQKVSSGTSFTGIWASLTSGDTIVGRQNVGTPYSDNAGYDNKNLRFRIKTGKVPTGVSGNGWIHVTSYPGPICVAGVGGNAPERAYYHAAPGSAGFCHGAPDNNGTVESQYWSVSCIDVDMDPAAAGNAAAVNLQAMSDHTRFFSISCGPWLSNLAPPNNAKSAGIGGEGVDVTIGWGKMHDIACDYSVYPNIRAQENHGIYAGSSTPNSASWRVKGCWIYNILGGSGFQTHDSTGIGNKFDDIGIIGNWIEDTYRYGIEVGAATRTMFGYNNIILRTGAAAISLDSQEANQVITFTHNTIYDFGGTLGAITNTSTAGTGSVLKLAHNIVTLKANRTGSFQSADFYATYSPDGGRVTLDENLYFDPDHAQAWGKGVPSLDVHAVGGVATADPLLDVSGGSYTAQAGSPALGACTLAELQAVATDFYGIARPVTGTSAPGGTKNDVGAGQGVGT